MSRAFHEFCRKIASMKLSYLSSGNASMREKDTVEITASGSHFDSMSIYDGVLCGIDGKPLKSGFKPSSELSSHISIYKARSNVTSVLHFQSDYATIVACRKELPKRFDVIPEIPFYIGKISQVSFMVPGKKDLAEKVGEAAKDSNLIILRNHGMFTFGSTVEETLQRAVFFELACKIIVMNGDNLQYISTAHKEELREMYEKKSSK